MEHTKEQTISNKSLQNLLTSLILYASEYPYTQQYKMLQNIFLHSEILDNKFQSAVKVFEQMINLINREIIYGPPANYIKVEDRPHFQHLNINCIYQSVTHQQKQKSHSNDQEMIKLYLEENNLSNFVPIARVNELLWYNMDRFIRLEKFINKKLTKNILKELEVDGQSWNKSTPVPTLLLTLKFCLKSMIEKVGTNNEDLETQIKYKKLNLFNARICFLHNKILNNPVKTLHEEVLTNYRKYIKIIKSCFQDKQLQNLISINEYIRVLLEYMHALVFYYKYEQAELILNYCKQLAQMEIQFTGKLGRRTKYQSFDTAQLIMNIKEKSGQQTISKNIQNVASQKYIGEEQIQDSLLDIPSCKDLILQELQKQSENKAISACIKESKFDEESILLEQPKLLAEEVSTANMSQTKLLITLSYLEYLYRTTPKDEILYQQVSTSIQQLLKHSQMISYPLMFNILMLRSKNQFKRVKNAERALEQFQTLKQQYYTKDSQSKGELNGKDMVYSVNYYVFLGFISQLADHYFELGMVMTAVELYQQVGMIQQCIDGLISRNYKDKAKSKLFNLLLGRKDGDLNEKIQYFDIEQNNKNKTPRNLCMLADIYSNSEPQKALKIYQQAWKLSNNRFSRAQRSIGWIYFHKKEYQKAADAFKLATDVNYYNPNTWFTLGCCFMNLKEYKKALPAFSQSISIDSTQGEAWGNMSSCYIFLQKYKQAFSTLSQAVKHSDGNWKLWANLLSISLKLHKYYKYFECVEKIVSLGRHQIVTDQVLHKISVIFRHYEQITQRRMSINIMKNYINRLFIFLISKIGQYPKLWKALFQYNLQVENFIKKNNSHYKNLLKENKIDKNDIVSDYYNHLGTIEEIENESSRQLQEAYGKIVESKQTQLNMTMKIGWDQKKDQAQNVHRVLKEYRWVWEKYSHRRQKEEDKTMQADYQLFIEGVKKKIEHCLEKNIQIEPKEP